MSTNGHLVIDGYNILHAWVEYRPLLKRGLDAAAGRLLDAVRVLHDFEGHALTIVYDGNGSAISIVHPEEVDSLTIVHSPLGVTADTIIERLLARAPETEGWVVASGDGAVGQTALSYGARAISPESLASWCLEAECRQTSWLQRRRKEID